MTTTLEKPERPVDALSLPAVQAFRHRNGEAHFLFACHAALPLGLTPELLYSLWANFQTDYQGKSLGIPWVATADLLLSNLCEEVGAGIYEMLPEVRAALVDFLVQDSRFEMKRIREIATFLSAYVSPQLKSDDLDIRDFAQAQNWLSKAYLYPEIVSEELIDTITNTFQQNLDDLLRIAAIVEALAQPLENYPALLIYARGMSNYVRGDIKAAQEKFDELQQSQDVHSQQTQRFLFPRNIRRRAETQQRLIRVSLPRSSQLLLSLMIGIIGSSGAFWILTSDALLSNPFIGNNDDSVVQQLTYGATILESSVNDIQEELQGQPWYQTERWFFTRQERLANIVHNAYQATEAPVENNFLKRILPSLNGSQPNWQVVAPAPDRFQDGYVLTLQASWTGPDSQNPGVLEKTCTLLPVEIDRPIPVIPSEEEPTSPSTSMVTTIACE